MGEMVQCPKCGRCYALQEGMLGRQVRCAGCGQVFQIAAHPGTPTIPTVSAQPSASPPASSAGAGLSALLDDALGADPAPAGPTLPLGGPLVGPSRRRGVDNRVWGISAAVLAVVVVAALGLIAFLPRAKGPGGAPESLSTAGPIAEVYPGVISPKDVPADMAGPEVTGPAFARLPRAQQVAQLVRKHGADSVVAVVLEGVPPDKATILRHKLVPVGGRWESFTSEEFGRWVCYVAPVADIEMYAKAIDLGQYKIDAEKRVLLVKIDPAKVVFRPPEQVAFMPRPATSPQAGPSSSPKLDRPPREPFWKVQLGGKEIPAKSVLLKVEGVSIDVIPEVVQYVRQKHPELTVSEEKALGWTTIAAMVCSPVDDLQGLGEKLGLGPVAGVEPQEATVKVRFDVDVVRRTAGDKVASRLDRQSIEWTVRDLKSADSSRRSQAMNRLKTTLPNENRAEVVGTLRTLIASPDAPTRKDAVTVLGVWGTPEDVPALLNLLRDDPDGWVHEEAIGALGRIKDERAIVPLCEWIERSSRAIEALKEFGPAAEPAILARLNRANPGQFLKACEVLGAIGGQKSLEKLAALAQRPGLAREARQTMAAIRKRMRGAEGQLAKSGKPSAGKPGQPAQPDAEEDESDVVAAALEDLASGDPREKEQALKLLAGRNPDPARRARVAQAVYAQMGDMNPVIHESAIRAFVVWHTPETLRQVAALLEAPNVFQRRQTLEVLARIKTKESAEAIFAALLRDRDVIDAMFLNEMFAAKPVEIFLGFGPLAEEAILAHLEDPDVITNDRVYQLLLKVGGEKTYRKLTDMQKRYKGRMNVLSRVHSTLAALKNRLPAVEEPKPAPRATPRKRAAAPGEDAAEPPS